ncbi:MAG: mechanosensitive ion channel family protein [Gemmataceae bacterium]
MHHLISLAAFFILCLCAFAQNKTIPPMPNSRSKPVETIETFCFAIDAVKKQIPGAMEVARDCMDFPPELSIAEKSKLVILMAEILDFFSPSFINAVSTQENKTSILYKEKDIELVLEQVNDGTWKFSRATMVHLPRTYLAAFERIKPQLTQKSQLVEGLSDPTELTTTFLARCVAGDFETAAQCLDLRGIAPSKRRLEGQRLAWLLGACIQRLGYVYLQDIPVDPLRPPYVWYSGKEGFVVSERIRQESTPDRWQFNQITVAQIDQLWEAVKNRPVNDKWIIIGNVIRTPDHSSFEKEPPKGMSLEFSSPRKMIQAFLKTMDEAENDDKMLEKAMDFLDLSNLSDDEKARLGSKLAEKMEVLLRKVKLGISELDDHYTAPMVVLSDKAIKIKLVRRADGRWGFSDDSVARLPAMYESLTPAERGLGDHLSGRASPRETFSTFLRAVNDGRLAEAAECLDLSDIPLSSRANMGPILAVKLKALIDRIGRVYFHELPSESDGPRYLWHRGPLGRIMLARRQDMANQGWRFSNSTIAQLDESMKKMIDLPVDPLLLNQKYIVTLPSWWVAPGIRTRMLMPKSLGETFGPLEIWQWMILGVLMMILFAFYKLFGRILMSFVFYWFSITEEFTRKKGAFYLFQISGFFTVSLSLLLLGYLDLPMDLASTVYSFDDLLLGAAAVWGGFGLIDMILLISDHTREEGTVRGFQDLLLPFLSKLVKTFIILGSLIYVVSCFDDGALMGRFLAGLGVAGLAISLAAQDSLKNLFATMLLIGDRTFSVGDLIQMGGVEGTVQSVGFRSTRLKTKEDSIIIIPNSNLAGGTIDNLGLRTHRRVHGSFTVPVNSNPASVLELRNQIDSWIQGMDGHDHKRSEVVIHGLTDRGIEIRFTAYVKGNGAIANEFRSGVTLMMVEKATQMGLASV